ncbi:acyltransferase [Flavobacterium sp. SM15]|uniref:acyltransferase family protein n=1 Tax=Flavobacterium sp. SM15 TaxID=2908005 RepID=UPI001EDA64B3|nr:acyltransferase family protein [Flavobacterium sp. SM15]MCG2610483.1 acyltransferase [Flavobacterium sp. SM15]
MIKRSASLDVLKLILALLVVALHIFPVAKLNGIQGLISYEISNAITRVAVPTFFIISGYLLRNKLEDFAYLKKYCLRILLLYFVWQLIYLPDFIRFYKLGRFTTSDAITKLVFGYWHLWYLLASVGGVVMLYFFRKLSVSVKFGFICALFLFGYAFQLAYKMNALEAFPLLKLIYTGMGSTRNFLFFAYPFLMLGSLYPHWKNGLFLKKSVLLFSFVGLLLESYFYYTCKLPALDFYISILPLSMLLLSFSVERTFTTRFSIPSSLSLGIYLTHPYMIRLVYEFLPQKMFEMIVLKYFMICLLSLLCWYLVERINRKFPYML